MMRCSDSGAYQPTAQLWRSPVSRVLRLRKGPDCAHVRANLEAIMVFHDKKNEWDKGYL